MSVSLRSLSDQNILSCLRKLVAEERELTLLVLLHLNEVERRRLHLKHAYKSMFDYCTSGLGYSASAASRRIRTARCIARFPEVYTLLESNEVNLSTVSQVSKILTASNRTEVFNRIRGKSQSEVDAIAAEYDPRSALPRDRVRPVVLLAPDPAPSNAGAIAANDPQQTPSTVLNGDADSANKYDRSGRDSDNVTVPPSIPTTTRHFVIRFSAGEEFMAKVEQVRSIAWHRLAANASFEAVFELALDFLITKESHEARHERRSLKATPEENVSTQTPSGRYVPIALRDEVFARDQGRCAFTDPSGRRCASTLGLQVDHIQPLARGGTSTRENLRLLCAYHNRLEAERVMGEGICERRSDSGS